jgi:type IV pilus assembly protein PilW
MKRQAAGFGLIEIMVALVLGLVITLGILQIFVSSKGTYVTQNASARMQEDARFVLSKLMQEIRMTGMYGCLTLDNPVVAPAIPKPADLLTPILWDNASKTLTLVTSDVGTTGGAPDWTIVSNCKTSARLFIGARAVDGQTSFPLRKLIYKLNGTDLTVQTANGQPAVLISNVARFDVAFGMAGSTMSYATTVSSASAPDVRSVRLTLMLNEPGNLVTPQTYNVAATLRNRF